MAASTPDVREAILIRLAAIILTPALGFTTAVRNRGLRSNEQRPAVIVLDGDEAPILTHGGRNNRSQGGRAMGLTPSIMQMRPELYILLKEDRPVNTDIGPDVNAMRIALVAAIAEDTALKTLVGSNGTILYNGCVTDLKSGSALTGQMRLDFAFNYTFKPTTA